MAYVVFESRLFRAVAATTLLLGIGTTDTAIAGAHSNASGPLIAVSTSDQARLQKWFDEFVGRMDDKFFGQVGRMNGTLELEDRLGETDYASFELRVTRGEVMEKAGRMLTRGKKEAPGRGDGELTWGRFYSLDMHPKTPLVGMLHATIVMQMYADGSVQTGGWLGVMPGTRIEEDLRLLKQVTDDYFAASNKDPALYRELICKGTHDTRAEFRRQPACSGVSFYGPPVFSNSPEESIRFIAGLFEQFVQSYMDISRERAGQPYTESDINAQDRMRKAWLIDQLFSDPFSSAIIPFEYWSFANMPPVIKF